MSSFIACADVYVLPLSQYLLMFPSCSTLYIPLLISIIQIFFMTTADNMQPVLNIWSMNSGYHSSDNMFMSFDNTANGAEPKWTTIQVHWKLRYDESLGRFFIRYISVSLYRPSEIYGRREIETCKFVRYIKALIGICHIVFRYIGVLLF